MLIHDEMINSIRILSAEMVQKANSGHPGAPMGMAPMAYALWAEHLKISSKSPSWIDRDRFVLSSGHASALLYSLLHIFGYNLSKEDLMSFRQFGSKTPGHPELDRELGIEISTGPLGQGIANAVGMAIAETKLAARFNKPDAELINHRTYAICGDGCLMEGISTEAASLAGTLKLSKLTVLYDDNEISIEGNTDIAFKEDVGKKFEALGWNVLRLKDGFDYDEVSSTLQKSKLSDKPTLIICPTIIGFGCESKQGKASAHGEPLGLENLEKAKKFLNVEQEAFELKDSLKKEAERIRLEKEKALASWEELLESYKAKYSDEYAELMRWMNNEDDALDFLNDEELFAQGEKSATRADSGKIINYIAKKLPNFIGGSADLAPSNKTTISDGGSYSAENRLGRNFHFGVREHAMAAICNGIAAHGGFRVFCSTFFVFSDYMKNAIRMSALMKLPVVYVLTHDSIGVGEDGATHQPIEQLAGLRSIPNLRVSRPADHNETAYAWINALKFKGPSCLALSRQDLPNFAETKNEGNFKGAYVIKETANFDTIILASGSELSVADKAFDSLTKQGFKLRLVSVPDMMLFLEQDEAYKESVLPKAVRKRVSIEAASGMPWFQLVGLDGKVISIDSFGLSAPAGQLFEHFGINQESVESAVKELNS